MIVRKLVNYMVYSACLGFCYKYRKSFKILNLYLIVKCKSASGKDFYLHFTGKPLVGKYFRYILLYPHQSCIKINHIFIKIHRKILEKGKKVK